jgi:putative transposase
MAGAGDPLVQERLRKLKQVEAFRKHGVSWPEIQALVGISRATYHRWRSRLKDEGLKGLLPKPKRPKRLRRKVHWTSELLIATEDLRRQNPTWGRWPIWWSLRKGGFEVSERTVGRILAHLEARGRVERVAAFLARARRGKGRPRPQRPYAQRKPRGYEARAPGDLVQLDTLTVTLGPGEVVKHFSALDLVTRFSLAQVHTRATANLAAGFLSALVTKAPFPIRAVQVDGGSEFMAEFEEACRSLGIRLFVLPPRSPKLNGPPSPSGPSRWTGGASSWPSLRKPAGAWESGSLCCPHGARSSTGTWSGCSAPSATSFIPCPCQGGLCACRPSWTLIWRTTTTAGPTWPWGGWRPWSSWLKSGVLQPPQAPHGPGGAGAPGVLG